MKNKYCKCYSLYDNYNYSENNLYYYRGILYALGFENRNFDMYINITPYCYKILKDIINQEKLCEDNVYYNIIDKSNIHSGMLWRILSTFKESYKYDIIGFTDSEICVGEDFFYQMDQNPNFGVYTKFFKHNKIPAFMWGTVQYLAGHNTYIRLNKLKTPISKIIEITESILNSKVEKPYEFDEKLLSALFCLEFYNNNILYFTKNDLDHNLDYVSKYTKTYLYDNNIYYKSIYNIEKKSPYYNNGYYSLYNKNRLYKDIKPNNYNKESEKQNDLDFLYVYKIKHMMLQIQRYILGYIDYFNVKDYEITYK